MTLDLNKDRVESLENEDLEKTKTIDLLTDQNDQLVKGNQKLQRKLEDQGKDYEQRIQEYE